MSSNVTIQLDNNLIEALSFSAREKGITLSQEIQYRIMLIPLEVNKMQTKPVSSRLRGLIHLPDDFDYKKALEERAL